MEVYRPRPVKSNNNVYHTYSVTTDDGHIWFVFYKNDTIFKVHKDFKLVEDKKVDETVMKCIDLYLKDHPYA